MKYGFTRGVARIEITFGVLLILAGTAVAAIMVAKEEMFGLPILVEEARKPIANHQTPLGIGDHVGGKPWRNAKVGLRRDCPQGIGKHFAVVHVVNDIWKVLAHIPGGVDPAGEQPYVVQPPPGP